MVELKYAFKHTYLIEKSYQNKNIAKFININIYKIKRKKQ